MITKIKLEKYTPHRSKFYGNINTPEDITSQLAMPFVDCERLDEVLDTSQVILYNNDSNPIKPFTRFIITITDTEEDGSSNDHYIYRYCENDAVTNVTMGNEPVYKHTLNLIEITKVLERVPVDNLCFTNYLDEKYGTEQAVKVHIDESESYASGIFYWGEFLVKDEYVDNTRFRGPYQYVGTTINTNVRLIVKATTLTQQGIVWGAKRQYTLPMTDFVVITPSGKTERLTNVSSYTYQEVGRYTFKQLYYKYNVSNNIFHYWVEDARLLAYWEVDVVEADTILPTRYNVAEVLDRLFSVAQLRRSGIDKVKFKLDNNLRPYLSSILSPEFSFTQSTLLDVLSQIGGYIHGIPKLIPSLTTIKAYDSQGNHIGTKINNYDDWDTITFTILGGNNEFGDDNYSLYDASHTADDYAKSFVSNVQNATQTNYAGNVSITEPFIDGFVSTRTENADFRINNDGAVIKLSNPIQSILQVLVVDSNGNKHDITHCVMEQASYNLLPEYSTNSNFSSRTRNFALMYQKGDNKITQLNYVPPTTGAEVFTTDEAIRAIIGLRTSAVPGNLKDICFQVKYIPIRNFKFKHYKSIVSDEPEELSLYYNQQANAIDIESYGENIKGALMKTGNAIVAETQYFDSYSQVPQKGQISKDNFYAYAINKEIRTFTPVKATTQWSKDFNRMNDFVGVKKTVRQYEISEEESIERNLDYQEFCVVSNTLDVSNYFNLDESNEDDAEQIQFIMNEIDTLGFPTSKLLQQIKSKLSNNIPDGGFKPISYVVANTITLNSIPEKHPIEIPERDPNAPEGYVPCRFYDQSNNLLAVIYADPEGWNTVQFDGETDEGYYTDITGIEGSGVYLGDCDMSAVYNRNFEIEGATLIGWEVRSQDNVVEGMVETFQILIDGEKNLFPIYRYHDEIVKKFILPVSCFPCGNSVVLYFKATDNYSAGTYSAYNSGSQNLEKYIEYSNDVGRFSRMSLIFGSKEPIKNGFSSYSSIVSNGQKLYRFTSAINESDVLVDFRDNEFIVEKDSREAISFTCQLNFITNESNIIIGKGLAHSMPMVGDNSTSYKFVLFSQKPSKFNSDIDSSTYIEQEMPKIENNNNLKFIVYHPTTALTNCVGYGIIDADNRLCIYVDGEIKAGESTKPIYLQFRGGR